MSTHIKRKVLIMFKKTTKAFMENNKKAFTLAEVLITLVIIGVIAAITVPTLMNQTKGQEYKSALKKGISAFNQALTMHYAMDGEGVNGGKDQSAIYEGGDIGLLMYIGDVIQKYINTTMLDEDGNLDLHFPGNDTNLCQQGYGMAATIDGIIFCVDYKNLAVGDDAENPLTAACNSSNTVPCASDTKKPNVYIDVNGEKGPNKMTLSSNHPKDQYQAMLYNQRLVPFGNATQQVMYDKNRTNASL